MAKKKKTEPEPLYSVNTCSERKCGECRFLTNVPEEQRRVPNVMGGCFLSGVIVYTDLDSCNDFKPHE